MDVPPALLKELNLNGPERRYALEELELWFDRFRAEGTPPEEAWRRALRAYTEAREFRHAQQR